jgi:hypothetical protein
MPTRKDTGACVRLRCASAREGSACFARLGAPIDRPICQGARPLRLARRGNDTIGCPRRIRWRTGAPRYRNKDKQTAYGAPPAPLLAHSTRNVALAPVENGAKDGHGSASDEQSCAMRCTASASDPRFWRRQRPLGRLGRRSFRQARPKWRTGRRRRGIFWSANAPERDQGRSCSTVRGN